MTHQVEEVLAVELSGWSLDWTPAQLVGYHWALTMGYNVNITNLIVPTHS